MNSGLQILLNRTSVVVLIAFFLVGTVPGVVAAPATFTGPYGNTITVEDDEIYGEFEGVDYSADEDSVTVDGHDVEDDDGGGGGGGGNAGAIIAGVAVVAVIVGVGIWWYYSHQNKVAANSEMEEGYVEHRLNNTASIRVTPRMMDVAGMAPEDVPDLQMEDMASAEIGLCLEF